MSEAERASGVVRSRLTAKARKFSDRKWFRLLVASIEQPEIKGIAFPGFPPEAIQRDFVGAAYRHTLAEAYSFYVFVKRAAARHGRAIGADTKFLDFGCGWGRYLRYFWKDIDEANLFGCDVNPTIVDWCARLGVPGRVDRIEPAGALPYPDAAFDSIIAYSVFTHLPADVHLHSMQALARVARPGAVFCLTVEPRRFLDHIAGRVEPGSGGDNDWHRRLAVHRPRLPEYYDRFDSGELVFLPTEPGAETVYGDAVVPLSWMETHWAPYFEVVDYVDDPGRFWQAVAVVRRTSHALEPDRPARER